MSDTNKRFFLDWEGLQHLWNTKIVPTFATKSDTDQKIGEVKGSIGTLSTDYNTFKENTVNSIGGINSTIASLSPKESEKYSDAINSVKNHELAPGIIINILNDESIENPDGSVSIYKAGLYVVTSSENIEKISTASGAGAGSNVEELAASLEALSAEVVSKAVISVPGQNPINVSKQGNTLAFTYDNEIVLNSESLNAVTHKAVSVMYGNLKSEISLLPKFKIEVVEQLPTENIFLDRIYLVPNNDPTDKNLYAEYIYISNGDTHIWEKLGEQTLDISGFCTVSEVTNLINNAIKNNVTTESLATELNKSKAEILTEVSTNYVSKTEAENFVNSNDLAVTLNNYYTKTESDGKYLTPSKGNELYVTPNDIKDFVTENDILLSIQTGTIGDEIAITTDQITSLNIE